MHNETTAALHAMFSKEDRGDFFHAYIYLKHTRHFVHLIKQMSGIPSIRPDYPLDQDLEAMPAHYSGTPKQNLWAAFASGAAMPLGKRQLRSVLAGAA